MEFIINKISKGFLRNTAKKFQNKQKFTKEIGFRTKVFDKDRSPLPLGKMAC